jgi:hypothetical protein
VANSRHLYVGNIQWTFCEHSVNIQWTFIKYSVWVEVDASESPTPLHKALKESTKADAEYYLLTWSPKMRVNKTKRRIPGVELRVHHVLPSGPHNTSIIIIIHWSRAKNQHEAELCVYLHRRRIPSDIISENTQGTLRDHSGNIRGTFKEHSGNIAFTKHSATATAPSGMLITKVEWHVQKAFREHSGIIQGTFREHWGNIQWTFREHSGNIELTKHSATAAAPSGMLITKVEWRIPATCTWGTFSEHSVNIQWTFSEYSVNIH